MSQIDLNFSIAEVFVRCFLGILFLFQGYDKLFVVKIKNVINAFHHETDRKHIPSFLLYFTSYFTSITEFIGGQRGYPNAFLLPEYLDESNEVAAGEEDPSERDKLFGEAAKIVVMTQQGSASMLQRKLKLGYNRAGRIVDQLEAAGIIGPFEGSKAREVLIKDPTSLEQILNKV